MGRRKQVLSFSSQIFLWIMKRSVSDMRKVFQRWGRVVDVFISRSLNNKNQ